MTDKKAAEAAEVKSPFDFFEMDEVRETDGVVIDYGPFWFKIGRLDRAGTPFARFMTEKMRPYTRAIQLGEMDAKVAEALTREGFAKHLVYAWGSKAFGDGKIAGKDKKPLDFSPENVEELFKQLPALFEDLLGEAKKADNFRKTRTEIDAGN